MKRLRKESAEMIRTKEETTKAAPVRARNIRATIAGVTASLTYGAGSAFAAGQDLFATAESLIAEWYGKFFGLSTALAVLVACVGFLAMMISGKRTRENIFSFIKTVALCWLAIQALGGFVALGRELTSGLNWTAS